MRLLVLALVVLNLLLFAWSRGWLPAPGAGDAASAREPQRLERQVRPQAVRLVTEPVAAPASAAGADAAASAVVPVDAAVCLEAGPFDLAEVERAERALVLLPAGSWRRIDADGGIVLRIDAADATIRAQLQALGAGELTAGFAPCAER